MNRPLTLPVRYGDEVFDVRLLPSEKPHTRTTISVAGVNDISATWPAHTSPETLKRALQKKGRWIYKKVEAFRQQQVDIRPRCYVSGESHLYLGRRYVLKLAGDAMASGDVKLVAGQLRVGAQPNEGALAKRALQRWYKQKANMVFARRLQLLAKQIPWLELPPAFAIRAMQKRWGSCTPQGELLINWHLVKAPSQCVDYVLLHELCHLQEHNHSDRFYRLLSELMPNWNTVKAQLDNAAQTYLNQ